MAVPVLYRPQQEGPCCDPTCQECRPRASLLDMTAGRRKVLGFFGVLGAAWLLGQTGSLPGVQQAQAVPAAPAAPEPQPTRPKPEPASAQALLSHPNLTLTERARLDLQGRGELAERGGRLDPVLLNLLWHLLRFHRLSVGIFATGHTRNVAGTNRQSMHYTGQAMDIGVLDGRPVSRDHAGAYEVVTALAARGDVTNLGHPWPDHPANPKKGVFSDHMHQGHLHIGVRK